MAPMNEKQMMSLAMKLVFVEGSMTAINNIKKAPSDIIKAVVNKHVPNASDESVALVQASIIGMCDSYLASTLQEAKKMADGYKEVITDDTSMERTLKRISEMLGGKSDDISVQESNSRG